MLIVQAPYILVLFQIHKIWIQALAQQQIGCRPDLNIDSGRLVQHHLNDLELNYKCQLR